VTKRQALFKRFDMKDAINVRWLAFRSVVVVPQGKTPLSS
jgi:hypothetical protein